MAAVRRGSRWYEEMPTEDDVRDWFATQPLHDGMDHNRYVSGLVLIGATEKIKERRVKQNGDPYYVEVETPVYVPYVKVDTRIAYFWDLVHHLNDVAGEDKYEGIIEQVPQQRIEEQQGYYNAHLPEGFFVYPVKNQNDTVSRFICCQSEARIIERQSGRVYVKGRGTKQTTMARNWADDNAIMKAETGSIGRALGVAGILVVGTGVATAEDMQEAAAGPAGAAAAGPESATLPVEVQTPQEVAEQPLTEDMSAPKMTDEERARMMTDDDVRELARKLQREFEANHPEQWQEFKTWWTETRKLGKLDDLSGPVLRGAVTKLERDLDAAKQVPA